MNLKNLSLNQYPSSIKLWAILALSHSTSDYWKAYIVTSLCTATVRIEEEGPAGGACPAWENPRRKVRRSHRYYKKSPYLVGYDLEMV